MARRTAGARRYAEAAFEVAERDGTLDEWQRDLHVAAETLRQGGVQRLLDNPSIPMAERRAAVEGVLSRRISRLAMNLVVLLVDRGRVGLVGAISDEFTDRLNRERGILKARLTSAAPLDETETAAIRDRIEQLFDSSVDLEATVDPALIGGLTVRVGDRLIDASVRGRLERLREQLVAGAL